MDYTLTTYLLRALGALAVGLGVWLWTWPPTYRQDSIWASRSSLTTTAPLVYVCPVHGPVTALMTIFENTSADRLTLNHPVQFCARCLADFLRREHVSVVAEDPQQVEAPAR